MAEVNDSGGLTNAAIAGGTVCIVCGMAFSFSLLGECVSAGK